MLAACYDPIPHFDMAHDLTDCYRTLDLKPNARPDEVKQSYRELVKVWHPDRFGGDERLQRKAQEKLKAINLAYERIQAFTGNSWKESKSASGSPVNENGQSSADATQPHSDAGRSNTSGPEVETSPEVEREPSHWGSRLGKIAVTILICAILKAIFASGHRANLPNPNYEHPAFQPSSYSAVVPEQSGKPSPPTSLKTERPSFSSPTRDYFTIGSLKSEVIEIQGAPASATDTIFTYGSSQVYFWNGGVYKWVNSDSNPLKVKWLPSKEASRDYFTIGSLKDEVLAVQGTPTSFTDTTFTYGSSEVHFWNGGVYKWSISPANPLRVKWLPAKEIAPKDYFTIGSLRDEVLAIQGTPTSFTDTKFMYGKSEVEFWGRYGVYKWKNSSSNPLKVILTPSKTVDAMDYFTIGSTIDEVLAVQGTPTDVSEGTYSYGDSQVNFTDGKVTTWRSGSSQPLKMRPPPVLR